MPSKAEKEKRVAQWGQTAAQGSYQTVEKRRKKKERAV